MNQSNAEPALKLGQLLQAPFKRCFLAIVFSMLVLASAAGAQQIVPGAVDFQASEQYEPSEVLYGGPVPDAGSDVDQDGGVSAPSQILTVTPISEDELFTAAYNLLEQSGLEGNFPEYIQLVEYELGGPLHFATFLDREWKLVYFAFNLHGEVFPEALLVVGSEEAYSPILDRRSLFEFSSEGKFDLVAEAREGRLPVGPAYTVSQSVLESAGCGGCRMSGSSSLNIIVESLPPVLFTPDDGDGGGALNEGDGNGPDVDPFEPPQCDPETGECPVEGPPVEEEKAPDCQHEEEWREISREDRVYCPRFKGGSGGGYTDRKANQGKKCAVPTTKYTWVVEVLYVKDPPECKWRAAAEGNKRKRPLNPDAPTGSGEGSGPVTDGRIAGQTPEEVLITLGVAPTKPPTPSPTVGGGAGPSSPSTGGTSGGQPRRKKPCYYYYSDTCPSCPQAAKNNPSAYQSSLASQPANANCEPMVVINTSKGKAYDGGAERGVSQDEVKHWPAGVPSMYRAR